jgi:hypothetical protein
MLDPMEKAYCLALESLRRKDYTSALTLLDRAAPRFSEDRDFRLLHESTRLLVAVKRELGGSTMVEEKLEIEEVFTRG